MTGKPNQGIKDPTGYRTDYLQFGDNIKVSTAEDKVRLDVCVPDPLIDIYDCGDNPLFNDLLSNITTLGFDGFGYETITDDVIRIKHEHYVYGGCEAFISDSDDDIDGGSLLGLDVSFKI